MVVTIHEVRTVKLTRLATALLEYIEASETPVYTDYALFMIVRQAVRKSRRIISRGKTASVENYRRTRCKLLLEANTKQDEDYSGVYRILSKPNPADDITCLIDPFCYISHLFKLCRDMVLPTGDQKHFTSQFRLQI